MRPLAAMPLLSYSKSLEKQMESVSNNLANVDTTGYKQDQPAFATVLANTMGVASTHDEEQFFSGGHLPPYGGQSVNYVQVADMGKDFSPGSLRATGNNLDFALNDRESFFSVDTPQGERFTRQGNFRLNGQNQLVNAEGFIINGKEGPLVVNGSEVRVSEDGLVSVDGRQVGGLKVVNFPYPERLQKMGNSQFAPVDAGNSPRIQENVKVLQGQLESSNVDSMKEMVRMIEVNTAYTTAQKAISQEDDLNHKAISLAEMA